MTTFLLESASVDAQSASDNATLAHRIDQPNRCKTLVVMDEVCAFSPRGATENECDN